MRAAVFVAPGRIEVAERPDPSIVKPTDAVVRVVLTCVCGSDLWSYRGMSDREPGSPIGHEFVGVVEDVGPEVAALSKGDLVIAPFAYNDGTCPHCLAGMTINCQNGGVWGARGMDGGQGEAVRVPFADATLVQVPGSGHTDEMMRSLLALSDVMCTGHHAAVSAEVRPAERRRRRRGRRRRAQRRHRIAPAGRSADHRPQPPSGPPAPGAGVRRHGRHRRTRCGGDGGRHESDRGRRGRRRPRVRRHRPGDGDRVRHRPARWRWSASSAPRTAPRRRSTGCSAATSACAAGGAPVRAYMPELLEDVLAGRIHPGRVFDHETDLEHIAEAYAAMDERRAIKSLVRVGTA